MNDKILILSNLVKTFEMANEKLLILDHLNFEISTPQKIVITGESGAGKSTLLSIIAGLDSFNSGEIYAKNYEVHKLDEESLSNYRMNYLGLIFQFHYLLKDFTALENVMLPALVAGIKKNEAKMIALDLLELSGGERQRVAVARALINSPNLILADEPTGNLDKNNAQLVKELLFAVVDKHKKTLILVTHDADITKAAEVSFSLEAGKLKKI